MRIVTCAVSLVLWFCLLLLIPQFAVAQDTTVWSAEIDVSDYSGGSLSTASFSNVGGTESVEVTFLWYAASVNQFRLTFRTAPDREGLTPHLGDLALAVSESILSGNRWVWRNVVEPDWADRDTVQVRLVKGAAPASETQTATNTATATNTPTPMGVEIDRAALVALYNATDGDNWTVNTNWLSSEPLGNWHGVRTDDDGRVSTLILADNNLNGTLPPQIGNLAKLYWLDLQGNSEGDGLHGALPVEIGNLASLERLHLNTNQLSGEIPSSISKLANLSMLILDWNFSMWPTMPLPVLSPASWDR